MAAPGTDTDRHARLILSALEEGYRPSHPGARFDVDRVDRWTTRIRVVDPDVASLEIEDRDGPVWDALDRLPEDSFQRIGLVFVLAPEELEDSPTNRMFEAERDARLRRRQVRADAASRRGEQRQ
jgi:hypothetical protein